MKKLAYIVSSPITYEAFLKDHATVLADEYDITLIANFPPQTPTYVLHGIKTIHVSLQRNISLLCDVRALFQLVRVLRREKFDIIHSFTPKAGLLSALAGWIARSPIRVHTFTGQVWATHRGAYRWLLKTMDKITLFGITNALADSHSQASFLASEGFAKPIRVLGAGAIAGINSDKFKPDEGLRASVRKEHGLETEDFVFIFLGRLNRDKGVMDLLHGFERANLEEHYKLLIVGPDEAQLTPAIAENPLYGAKRIVLTGSTSKPERELNAGDVFCLPSYREGFGLSVLEAAAVGLPAIASRIYGLTDAVVDGETGIMHEAGNVMEIAACLRKLADDPDRARRMGSSARARVVDVFSPESVTSDLRAFYSNVLYSRSSGGQN